MTSVREVRWERMFPDELETAFAHYPVLYLTYGLCEPHGPQCALGLDALKAHALACRAARNFGGIVAPPDYWHIHEMGAYASFGAYEIGEVPRSWLTGVPPWVHFRQVCYHIRAAEALKFRAVILLTGHYGPNWKDLVRLVELLQPHVGTRLYALPDFEANEPGFDGKVRDHAGKVETSLLWALEPGCVDVSRFPATDEPGPHFAMGADAREANRRVGERMADDIANWLGHKARELLDDYEQVQPQHTFRAFARVEEVWAQVVLPELPAFLTMQLPDDRKPPAEDSLWRDNWFIPPFA